MSEQAIAIAGMYFAFGVLALLTVIIAITIWQLSTNYRAKASAAREEAYRKLAEQAVTAQTQINVALAEMSPRLAAIEKMLREVE